MEVDSTNFMWQKYMADCIGSMTERLYRWSGAEKYDIPLFSEIIEPEKSTKDTRTAEEIKNDILARLSE